MRSYHTFDYDDYYYSAPSHRNLSYSDKKKILEQLISQLAKADRLKSDLYYNTISLEKLRNMKAILDEKITLENHYEKASFSLSERFELNRAFSRTGLWDLSIYLQRDKHNFPSYLLCESVENYFGNYGIVLADFYRSPQYEIHDERFVRLMSMGHEKLYMRMSIFRDYIEKINGIDDMNVDRLLKILGEDFFSGAWHEDQIVSFILADKKQLGIQSLKESTEIVYSILSLDLSAIRNSYTSDVKWFFSKVFPRKSLGMLFNKIEKSNASDFKFLEQRARHWYKELGAYFSSFLSTKVEYRDCTLPVYKLIFANIFRLELISDVLVQQATLKEPLQIIREISSEAIRELTE